MFSSPRRPRAAAFRGALWITLVALAATVVALTVQYTQTVTFLDRELKHLVDEEVKTLVAQYRRGGVANVEKHINPGALHVGAPDMLHLLATPRGDRLAGSLTEWPSASLVSGWHNVKVRLRGADSRRWVLGRVVALDRDLLLIVGHVADDRRALQQSFLAALLWSVLATVVVGLGLGWWLSRRSLRFVDRAAESGSRFLGGSLSERLPVSSRGDEYDRLAEVVNACFAEVERVVIGLRAATDGLAHDLKTPLTRVKVRTELAIMKGGSDPLREEFLSTARDVDALLRLIDGLLALAHAETAPAVSFEQFSLAEAVAEVIELYAPVAEDAGIALAVSLRPATMRGMRALLVQSAANLLENSIKFAPSGSVVVIETVTEGDRVRLIVADNGPGIPAHKRKDVLARFTRMDASRGTPGTGLGLSLVEVVVRVHNGTLHLHDNEPGLRVELELASSELQTSKRGEAEEHSRC